MHHPSLSWSDCSCGIIEDLRLPSPFPLERTLNLKLSSLPTTTVTITTATTRHSFFFLTQVIPISLLPPPQHTSNMPANTNTESMEMGQQPNMAAQPQMTTEQPVSCNHPPPIAALVSKWTSRQAFGVPSWPLGPPLGGRIAPWQLRSFRGPFQEKRPFTQSKHSSVAIFDDDHSQ